MLFTYEIKCVYIYTASYIHENTFSKCKRSYLLPAEWYTLYHSSLTDNSATATQKK